MRDVLLRLAVRPNNHSRQILARCSFAELSVPILGLLTAHACTLCGVTMQALPCLPSHISNRLKSGDLAFALQLNARGGPGWWRFHSRLHYIHTLEFSNLLASDTAEMYDIPPNCMLSTRSSYCVFTILLIGNHTALKCRYWFRFTVKTRLPD